MKKKIAALLLGLTLSAPMMEGFAKTNETKAENKNLVVRLEQIKSEALKGNLSNSQRNDLRKETLNIRDHIKQNDPVLIISLTTALIVALILVLLARR